MVVPNNPSKIFKGSLKIQTWCESELQGPGTILVQNGSASLASDVHHRQLRGRLGELYETHCSDSAWAADNCLTEMPQNGVALGSPLHTVIRLLKEPHQSENILIGWKILTHLKVMQGPDYPTSPFLPIIGNRCWSRMGKEGKTKRWWRIDNGMCLQQKTKVCVDEVTCD